MATSQIPRTAVHKLNEMETKYIFITGGVASSLGKGIISASLGKLLQARGYKITIQKFDPYINIDPGTLNPYEHGECYVTADGQETDLDLGHYERFTGIRTTRDNSVTTGKIYLSVIERERRGDYLGKTIQVVPHITDEIKRRIRLNASKEPFDFVITEIGGTIGDIEGQPFLEAIRQLRWELGRNALNIHLTYVPYLSAAGELKTKPTQTSVKQLQGLGIQPEVLVLRTEHDLSDDLRAKVAHFCNVEVEAVIQSQDLPSIYEVPTADNVADRLAGLDGIVICPGFGQRGIEGKIIAAGYARTRDLPAFGICLGMQMMVIEYSRNVLGLKDADSMEMNPVTPHNVIDMMEEQLGAYNCRLAEGSKARAAYGGADLVSERHRHRYEVNNHFRDALEASGMKCVGINPENDLVEIVEVPSHRWYIGTQFHPEYSSTVLCPHPLFMDFIKACAGND